MLSSDWLPARDESEEAGDVAILFATGDMCFGIIDLRLCMYMYRMRISTVTKQRFRTLLTPATLASSRLTLNPDSSTRLRCSTHSTTQRMPTTKGLWSPSNL